MANNGKIAGRNVYTNNKNQTIIYDRLTKTGYILKEKDAGRFVIFQNRYLIVLLVFMFGILLGLKWTTMLGIAALAAILFEYSYRMIFLRSQINLKKFTPEKPKTLADAIAESATKKTALMHGCLILLLGVLLVYNSFVSANTSPSLKVCSAAACAVCAYYGISYLAASSRCRNASE